MTRTLEFRVRGVTHQALVRAAIDEIETFFGDHIPALTTTYDIQACRRYHPEGTCVERYRAVVTVEWS